MAYKKWTAGEQLNAADLNTAIRHNTPAWLCWAGHGGGDTHGSSAVITASGRYLLSSTTTAWYKYDALYPDAPFPRSPATVSGLTITPTVCARVIDGAAAEYVLAFADGGTVPYRYATDGSTETLVTFSGTAVTTGARRIGYDPNTGYIYIMDGASSAATAIKRYTLSGTVLTYVDTITLGTAPTASGAYVMWIGANYLCIVDDTTNTIQIKRYGKNSGTLIDSTTWGGWNLNIQTITGGVAVHPNKELYGIAETVASNTESFQFIRWSVDATE